MVSCVKPWQLSTGSRVFRWYKIWNTSSWACCCTTFLLPGLIPGACWQTLFSGLMPVNIFNLVDSMCRKSFSAEVTSTHHEGKGGKNTIKGRKIPSSDPEVWRGKLMWCADDSTAWVGCSKVNMLTCSTWQLMGGTRSQARDQETFCFLTDLSSTELWSKN